MAKTHATLVLSMDGLVLKEIELNKERVTIGRRPSNDIKIDNLAISGEHAVVVTILNDSFLEDLNSTNGTLVNGRPIRKHVLIDGDMIEMGKYKLKYIAGKPDPAGEAANYEKTVIMQPRPAAPESEKKAEPPETPRHAPEEERSPEETQVIHGALEAEFSALEEAGIPPGAVRILNGEHAGRELELTKVLATLGQPGVQVAVIAKRPNGYFISHVEGDNMPIVNGNKIVVQAHRLVDHDIIEIAGIRMEFFLKT
ncbi:MAG: FHA domain-containing protein [Candidatus Accumulibacter sp.]|nr:FHA domain-containing protein [Accumulibacter sp.]